MNEANKVKVMIVDDHVLVREGLVDALESSGDYEIVGQASDGQEAIDLASQVNPNLVVMDILLPVKDGIDACREIKDSIEEVKVMILTASDDESVIMKAVAAGATGFLQKYSSQKDFLVMAGEVAAGEFRIPPEYIRLVFQEIQSALPKMHTQEREIFHVLTDLERDVLRKYVVGMTHDEIAETRDVKPLTIRNQLYTIQRKLGFKNKQALVSTAVLAGLLDEEEVEVTTQ